VKLQTLTKRFGDSFRRATTRRLRCLAIARTVAILSAGAALSTVAETAHAQRAAENAVTTASDAFGTSVGDESIGLYASGDVRGFSAFAAGNVRIEGLYFDLQGALVDQVEAGSTIQVGLSAMGYPFPAPTGIVDYQLRRVGNEAVVSVRLGLGDYFGPNASIDASLPLGKRVGLNVGASAERFEYADGADLWFARHGGVLRWAPIDDVELTTFFSRYDYGDEEASPTIFTAGAFLPPRIERRRFYGQDWADWRGHSQNYGALGKARLGVWRIAAGAFESEFTFDEYGAIFYRNTRSDGSAERAVLLGEDQRSSSTSGEFQVMRDFVRGERLHRIIGSIRARRVQEDLGGFAFAALGAGRIGVPDPVSQPPVTFGDLTRDSVQQETAALGYELRWQGRGELNVGLQKTRYEKTVLVPGAPPATGRDSPRLWNASAALTLSDALVVYGATTRGLEESGTAPPNATNANQVLPALQTRQAEVGLRYVLPGGMRLVTAAFDVRRPYFEIDASDGAYRVLGDVKHAGVELSLAGEPVDGLSVVAGAVLLRPRVTGEAVRAERLGERPLGIASTLVDLRLDYRLQGIPGASIDFGAVYNGRRVARTDNSLYIPERVVIDVGARYRFALGRAPAVLRVQIRNATNVFGWRVLGGGGFAYLPERRIVASIAADF
jgi:iron complex outermembrane receptor protein